MSNSIKIEEPNKPSNENNNALGDQAVTIKPITHLRDASIDLSDQANQNIDELLNSITTDQSSEVIEYHSNVEFEDIQERIDQNRLNPGDNGSLVPTEFLYSNGEADYNVELQDFSEDELIYEVQLFHPEEGMVEGEPQEYSGQEIEQGSFEISISLDEAEKYSVAPEEDIAEVFETYRRKQQ